jgi:hypothetical protein
MTPCIIQNCIWPLIVSIVVGAEQGRCQPTMDPRLLMGSGAGGNSSHLPAAFLAAAAAAGVGGGVNRLPAAYSSSATQQAANSSNNAGTPLARFFSPDVLAAAQGGACPPMPPLPIRQALTLEEIERQAAAAAVRI